MIKKTNAQSDPVMIEVFKTNVQQPEQAATLVLILSKRFPSLRINFDLDDCDKILRVEGKNILPGKIISLLHANGYQCGLLE
jgi:hypothetical protein